jgi:hypothetical protein
VHQGGVQPDSSQRVSARKGVRDAIQADRQENATLPVLPARNAQHITRQRQEDTISVGPVLPLWPSPAQKPEVGSGSEPNFSQNFRTGASATETKIHPKTSLLLRLFFSPAYDPGRL